jgi:hypothetical protein
VAPVGEKRGRHYVATNVLKEIMLRNADAKRASVPYELLRQRTAPGHSPVRYFRRQPRSLNKRGDPKPAMIVPAFDQSK